MKKSILLISLFFCFGSYADYGIKIPLTTSNGGLLPEGSLEFIKNQNNVPVEHPSTGNWSTYLPLYSDWQYVGEPNCLWFPEPQDFNLDEMFYQYPSNCYHLRERTKQDREQEVNTKEIKNVGPIIVESENTPVDLSWLSRPAYGTRPVTICSYQPSSSYASVRRNMTTGRIDYSIFYQGNSILFFSNTSTFSMGEEDGSYSYSIGQYIDDDSSIQYPYSAQIFEVCRTKDYSY